MLYLGADHAGFKLKERLKPELKKLGYNFVDLGNARFEPQDDYPDFGYKVAKKVAETGGYGILFCGSAQGMCIAANKVKGVRAVAVFNIKEAKLTREHNDANVLCLSGWDLGPRKAKKFIRVWLETKFSGEERHRRRVEKIKKIESYSEHYA